jgi:hypothetical protein
MYGFDDQILQNSQLEKIYFFGSKSTIHLSPGPHKKRPKLKKKPSALKKEYPAYKNEILNFFYFCKSYVQKFLIILRLQQPHTCSYHADYE